MTERFLRMSSWLSSMMSNVTGLTMMAGDASGRHFYRFSSEGNSLVIMDSGKTPLWPWLDIHRLLDEHGFPVPAVVHSDASQGFAIQEDLGQVRLTDLEGEEYSTAIEDALDILSRMQTRLTRETCSHSIAGRRSFTPTFFMAELEHTLEHLFFRLMEVPDSELLDLQDQMRLLCNNASEIPISFSHRDFHSANLMMSPRGIVMVDWQDARIGPQTYDLVSLLRDSYVDIGDCWEVLAGKFILISSEATMFHVAISACQRCLKSAGTFAYQYRAFEKDQYLVYLPRTFRYLDDYRRICPDLDFIVDNVYRILDSYHGEVDLRGFRESDEPLIRNRGAR
jgi:aminoglycoside/choline kinase family phosphotransferase